MRDNASPYYVGSWPVAPAGSKLKRGPGGQFMRSAAHEKRASAAAAGPSPAARRREIEEALSNPRSSFTRAMQYLCTGSYRDKAAVLETLLPVCRTDVLLLEPRSARPPELDEAVTLLRVCLGDADADIRMEAADALAAYGDASDVVRLCTALRGDRNWFVRDSAAHALGRLGRLSARQQLHQTVVDDRHPMVRRAAVRALSDLRDTASIPFLRERLQRERIPLVQCQIAASLYCLGCPEYRDVVLAFEDRQDWEAAANIWWSEIWFYVRPEDDAVFEAAAVVAAQSEPLAVRAAASRFLEKRALARAAAAEHVRHGHAK